MIGREEERERVRWEDDNPGSPLPLPLLTCKQASATRREGEREDSKRRLTRFRGLWSIKGLHVNSKTTPTISNSVVRLCVAVGCQAGVFFWMCEHLSLKLRSSFMSHLWRHRSRNLRILRAAWFCFLVRRLLQAKTRV